MSVKSRNAELWWGSSDSDSGRVVMSKNPIACLFVFLVGFCSQKPKVGFCYFAFFNLV